MAILSNVSIALHKLPKDKIKTKEVEKNGVKEKQSYIDLTFTVNDELDMYGNQTSVKVSQTQEERDSKQKATFVGNGNVQWTNNVATMIERPKKGQQANQPAEEVAGEDLPF